MIKIKKILLVAILFFIPFDLSAQLANFLNKNVDGIATVRNNQTLLDSLFLTSTYSQAIFDIIAHLQKVGQNTDNYTSVAAAKTAAKANSGLLVIPRVSSLFQDSTFTISSTDSIAIFDFRNGKLNIIINNFGYNTSTFDGTAAGVIAIANGTAPTAGTANQSYLYARDVSSSSEIHVMDEAGNESQISPHDSETGKWIFYSKNVETGRIVRVEMEELIFDLALMMRAKTGKNYVYESKKLMENK